MTSIYLGKLSSFVAVAQCKSFTKAAALMGIAVPSMSQTIRSLEEQLGVQLLNRTTRSVVLTEAGEQLLAEIQPNLDHIDRALEGINAFRDKPIGKLRIAASRPFATMLLAPIIGSFLAEYPDIRLEICIDDTLGDIVSGRFDAGIRVSHRVERDMEAIRLTEQFRMLTVASPSYMAGRRQPTHPSDLQAHNCILFRTPWDRTVHALPFVKGGEHIEIACDGSLTVNDSELWLSAALDGVGVGYFPEPVVAPYVAQGRLVPFLEDWAANVEGMFLYHPSRRRPPMALSAFIQFIRTRRPSLLAVSSIRSFAEHRS